MAVTKTMTIMGKRLSRRLVAESEKEDTIKTKRKSRRLSLLSVN
jgi:hypothetical protein